jgi:uncharacterized membrane-anchored protein
MKLKLFILILALQSAWILGTTLQQERALAVGKTILLETERVDPRDLLRGDYLILNYKISSVPVDMFSPPIGQELPEGANVFVALEPRGQYYEVWGASTSPPEHVGERVILQGRCGGRRWNRTNSIHVEYGLERYYVAEGKGNPTGKITVEAAVPASGKALIKQVFVDGKPFAEAMRRN